jgi:PBSX family phage terminase large subunit
MVAMEISKLVKRLSAEDAHERLYECPVCNEGTVTVKDNVFYGKCDKCSATIIDYEPLPHQQAFHASNARYRMNIGGFGSGKTTAVSAEFASAALSIPNGRGVIVAVTTDQVINTVIPELDKFIPPWFIEQKRMKPYPYYKLTNGHEIMVYPSDDQQKIRSLNLTEWYIEEASGVDYAIFDILTTRLRNKAAVVRDERGKVVGFQGRGMISTNPENGWIKDDFLLKSGKVFASPSIDLSVYKPLMKRKERINDYHTFISSTRDNHYLHSGYIQSTIAGKSQAWVRKYIDCYLDFKDGVVYPDFNKNLVEPFAVPKEWKRVFGFDPGFNDPTAFVAGAIDPKDGTLYIYKEYKVPEQPISYHAAQLKPLVEGFDKVFPIQADPSVRKRNDRDGTAYAQYFKNISGLILEPGNNDILYGIEKMRDYMFAGKLKFFNDLEALVDEASRYMYASRTATNTNDKPIDKNNHLMDALRYVVARLPKDPNQLIKIYSKVGDIQGWFEQGIKKPELKTAFNAEPPEQAIVYGKGKIKGGFSV